MAKAFNILVSVATIAGLIIDSGFVYNVAIGFVWLAAVSSLLVGVMAIADDDSEMKSILSKHPAWYITANGFLDIIIVVLLAGTAHWWAFGFFATGSICYHGAWKKATETDNAN